MLQQAHVCLKALFCQRSNVDQSGQSSASSSAYGKSSTQHTSSAMTSLTCRKVCIASAVEMHLRLLGAASHRVFKAREAAGPQVEVQSWVAAAMALPELVAAAAEPALLLIAGACHMWHKQLSMQKGLAAGSSEHQEQQRRQVQHRFLRPLQASRLPRQPLQVQLEDVAAVHQQLLQHVLDDTGLFYVECLWHLSRVLEPTRLARIVCGSTGALMQALGAESHIAAVGDAACEGQGVAACATLPGEVELIMEAMQLQHCCLQQGQQQQQQQQKQGDVDVSVHNRLLVDLDWLVTRRTAAQCQPGVCEG
jgi:hypothetical protein